MASNSNFQLNANFNLGMDQNTVQTILPSSQGGDLKLSYNINQPEFVASTLRLHSHFYYLFGIMVTIYIIIFYFLKAVVINPNGRDKGQLIAHILFMKTPALMIYPSYAELISYCSGFMISDMPWLNRFFGSSLSLATDSTPFPYLLFYTSLSLASTYLLALVVICTIVLSLVATAYLCESTRGVIRNMGLFVYNFFLGGVSFAALICMQGALMNVASEYTLKSNFYLLGFIILIGLLMEAVWSFWQNHENLFKLRVLVKALVISLLHYNALYLLAILIGT